MASCSRSHSGRSVVIPCTPILTIRLAKRGVVDRPDVQPQPCPPDLVRKRLIQLRSRLEIESVGVDLPGPRINTSAVFPSLRSLSQYAGRSGRARFTAATTSALKQITGVNAAGRPLASSCRIISGTISGPHFTST